MKRKIPLIILCVIAVLCFVIFGIPAINDAKNAREQARLEAEIEAAKYAPKSPSTTEDSTR